MLPAKDGALRRKCVPRVGGTLRALRSLSFRHRAGSGPTGLHPRPGWSCQNRKPGKPLERLPGPDRRHPQTAMSHNSQTPQPDRGMRNERNCDDRANRIPPTARRSRRSTTARCRHRIRPARTLRPRSPCRRALGSALRRGPASRPRRSVRRTDVRRHRPRSSAPFSPGRLGRQRLPRSQPARCQQRELAHSGRPKGRCLSGAAGCRRHSRAALASQRVGNQRDTGRQESMGVRRTQRHPGRLRSRQRRRHLRAAGPLSLLRERQRH